jgi:hypothetical protein
MEVVATSTSADYRHDRGGEDLIPLEELIRQTPGAHPIGSAEELRCDAFETDQELQEFLAFVSESRATPTLPEPLTQAVVLDTDVASRSFKGLLPPTLSARLAGRQPLLTFVTIGELTQWTNLRRWGPRNRSMLETWLSDKPVIPGGKSIAVIWGELLREPLSVADRGQSTTHGWPPAALPTACRLRR